MEEIAQGFDGRDAFTNRALEPEVDVRLISSFFAREHPNEALHEAVSRPQVSLRERRSSMRRALILFLIIVVIV
ncbi:MAG: hypothetical protein QM817_32620 [Archangium sp.]